MLYRKYRGYVEKKDLQWIAYEEEADKNNKNV